MSIESQYHTEAFEVLESDTHKYASTEVSGGGTAVHSEHMSMQKQISSTTTHHSKQEIWVKSLDTDKERKLEFNDIDVDARVGNRIVCAWNNESEKLERIYNLEADRMMTAGGTMNDWTGLGKAMSTPSGRWVKAFKCSWFVIIPYLSILQAFLAANAIGKGQGLHWPLPFATAKRWGLSCLAIDALLIIWTISNGFVETLTGSWFWFAAIGVAPLTYLTQQYFNDEYDVLKAHSDELNALVRQKSNSIPAKTAANQAA